MSELRPHLDPAPRRRRGIRLKPAPAELLRELPPRVHQVIELAAADFDVTARMVVSPSQSHPVVLARRVAIHTLRRMGFSTPQIGLFVARHHTTVLAALARPLPGSLPPGSIPGGPPAPAVLAVERSLAEEVEAAVWAAWVKRFPAFRIIH